MSGYLMIMNTLRTTVSLKTFFDLLLIFKIIGNIYGYFHNLIKAPDVFKVYPSIHSGLKYYRIFFFLLIYSIMIHASKTF